MDGFFDRGQQHGPIRGHGPSFKATLAAFNSRQARLQRTGRWRKAPAQWKRDDGTYIDPDFYVVNWGQD